MKIGPRQADAFLRNPGGVRVVLLHGEDQGLVRQRARDLTRSVAGSVDDPFRVVASGRGAGVRLSDELASMPLTGGRRVVLVSEAGEGLCGEVGRALSVETTGVLILEAAALSGRSKLRSLIERSPLGASVSCYPDDDRTLAATVRSMLGADDISIAPEALDWVVAQLGADRGTTRRECEKLAVYAGPDRSVTLEGAIACVGDVAGLSLDDAVFAAAAGEQALMDRAIRTAFAEGVPPVQMTRALIAHLHRLREVRTAMDRGCEAGAAVRSVRPPVLFSHVSGFAAVAHNWSVERLVRAAAAAGDVERACKRTGAPAELLVARFFASIASKVVALR